jgi:hypothetical protein
MFGIFRRLSALEADVKRLDREVGAGEYERMRSSVLNALRALRRGQEADEKREAPEGQPVTDRASEAILARRAALRRL